MGEQNDLADEYPDIVRKLLQGADKVRMELGDSNQIGIGGRFFDESKKRPFPIIPDAT